MPPEREEIEITPEMIEAGTDAIAWLDFLDDPEKIVTSVFLAMWKKMPREPLNLDNGTTLHTNSAA